MHVFVIVKCEHDVTIPQKQQDMTSEFVPGQGNVIFIAQNHNLGGGMA